MSQHDFMCYEDIASIFETACLRFNFEVEFLCLFSNLCFGHESKTIFGYELNVRLSLDSCFKHYTFMILSYISLFLYSTLNYLMSTTFYIKSLN